MEPQLQVWRQDLLAAVRSLVEDTVVFSHFIAINTLVGHALLDNRVTIFLPDNASITSLKIEATSIELIQMGTEMPTLIG